MKVEYRIFNPGGNITALVFNNHYSSKQKKVINDYILMNNKEVEQVGFIERYTFDLQMAGGEFCGNAIRCAVKYYLESKNEKNIFIKVSGMSEKLNAGINEEERVWVDIPIESVSESSVKGEKIVKIEGITHIVVSIEKSKIYLRNKANLKEYAKKIINRLKIYDKAVGVMFTQIKDNVIRVYPIVWVRDMDTLFFETACGSGTVAVVTCSEKEKINVLQPSGYMILGEKIKKRGREYIRIIGDIISDNIIRNLDLEISIY